MGTQYVDLTKYFTRTLNRPDIRILLNPGTNDIIKEQKASNRFDFWKRVDDFDPGNFMGGQFGRRFGLDPNVFRSGRIEDVMSQVKSRYGMDLGQYLSSSPDKREQQFNKKNKVFKSDGSRRQDPGPLIDPKTGLPNRPPESPEEAMFMQWKAFEANRQQNLGLLKNAVATLRYGLGGVTRGGPFSSAAMQSPLLSQMANTYMNTQFEAPDLSYFLRPDVPGYGGGQDQLGGGVGLGFGGGRTPQPIPTIPGVKGVGNRQQFLPSGIAPSFVNFGSVQAPQTPATPFQQSGRIAPAFG